MKTLLCSSVFRRHNKIDNLKQLACDEMTAYRLYPSGEYVLRIRTADDLDHDAIVKQLRLADWAEYDKITQLIVKTRIGVLPDLPQSLDNLDCSDQGLTSLPLLPIGLKTLWVSSNNLTSLGDLPLGLKLLDCSSNQLTSIPDLPKGLSTLYCDDNKLIDLPVLPDTLAVFYCHFNSKLKVLYDLPFSLTRFCCDNKHITENTILPPNLEHLDCFDDGKVNILPYDLSENIMFVRGYDTNQLHLDRYNRRCMDLGIETASSCPTLERRNEVKKQHDHWRFRLDGPEWNDAVGQLV